MRPASNFTTPPAVDAGFRHFNSPLPYLFGGLALMMGLITMALIILACSYRVSSSNSTSETEQKPAKQVEMQPEMEPKIVVIMAGDDRPTYLAKPISCTCPSEQV